MPLPKRGGATVAFDAHNVGIKVQILAAQPITITNFMTPIQINELRKRIADRVKELNVQPKHTDEGHFYYIPSLNKTFGSVTAEHRNIKDPSLRNFEKNEALRAFASEVYSRARTLPQPWHPSAMELDAMREAAAEAPILARDTAGSKGTYIHDCREEYFRAWIIADSMLPPEGMTCESIARGRSDIPPELFPEVVSGCAAIDKFIKEWQYVPICCEVLVYDENDEVAGTLDDIGLVNKDGKIILVLLDVKSSNQFKDVYTLQVMRYERMFEKLFDIKPDEILIVKTGKDDRKYKLEWFSQEQMEAGKEANAALIIFNKAWEKVKESRKREPIVYNK